MFFSYLLVSVYTYVSEFCACEGLENYLKDFPHMRHLLAYNVVYCSLEELDSYWINPPSEKDLANFPMLKLPL